MQKETIAILCALIGTTPGKAQSENVPQVFSKTLDDGRVCAVVYRFDGDYLEFAVFKTERKRANLHLEPGQNGLVEIDIGNGVRVPISGGEGMLVQLSDEGTTFTIRHVDRSFFDRFIATPGQECSAKALILALGK